MEISLMEKFADPALFDTLSMSEKATGALVTTGMGMGITFVVLVLLWGVIAVMSRAIGKTSKPSAVGIANIAGATQPIELKSNKAALETEADEAVLVAVITAAIEAYEASTGTTAEKFVVKRITRTGGSLWREAGVSDCAFSRKM